MTLALLPTETQPVVLRPLLRKPDFPQWQDDLNYLEKEVKFYRYLLKAGVANAPCRSKPSVFALLNEFSNLEDIVLSELRRELAVLSEKPAEEEHSDAEFLQKMLRQNAASRLLKSKVFALIHDLQKLTIL